MTTDHELLSSLLKDLDAAVGYVAPSSINGKQAREWLTKVADRITRAESLLGGGCKWWPLDDEYMPGTWRGKCGITYTFSHDGPVENEIKFCMECGKPCEPVPLKPTGEL